MTISEDGTATAPEGGTDDNSKSAEQTQTADALLANADIGPVSEHDNTVSWDDDPRKGDARYFQSGAKQGQIRPSAAVSGVDAARAFAGLDTSDLRQSATRAQQRESAQTERKQRESASKKKEIEGKIAAGFIMQLHDVGCEYISDGTIGRDWTPEQIAERLSYRAQVQDAYAEYMATLNVPLHPAVVLSGLSLRYMLPAFQTERGASRVERAKAKVYSWWLSRRAK